MRFCQQFMWPGVWIQSRVIRFQPRRRQSKIVVIISKFIKLKCFINVFQIIRITSTTCIASSEILEVSQFLSSTLNRYLFEVMIDGSKYHPTTLYSRPITCNLSINERTTLQYSTKMKQSRRFLMWLHATRDRFRTNKHNSHFHTGRMYCWGWHRWRCYNDLHHGLENGMWNWIWGLFR